MAGYAGVLQILVTASTAAANAALAKTSAQLTTTAASANATTAATKKASTGMTTMGKAAKYGAGVGIAALGVALKKSIDEAREAQKATAQTRAVLKSMGNEAGISAAGVEKLAAKISTYAGVDDEAIQASENLLLTFKNLRNEAGKGNDIFTQTTALVVDMSAALGQDLKSSSIQLGKALNDPSVALTALRRVGVSFNETETEMIKKMFEAGNQMKAQKIILAELNREFRGSAKAQADPWDKLNVALENLAESVGTSLLPTFSRWANVVAKFLHQMNTGKKAGGDFQKALKTIGDVLEFLWPLVKLQWQWLFKMGKALVDIGKFGVKAFNKVKNAMQDVWQWVKTAWKDIGDFLSRPFEFAKDKIIDFINLIIKALNIIPGVDIGLVSSGPSSQQQQAKKKGGGRQHGGLAAIVPGMGSGDKVPMQAMVEPGEGIFVMNRNAMGALQAANDAVPRFRGGGAVPRMDVGGFLGNTPIAKGIGSVGDLIAKLPSTDDLPDWLKGTGTYALNAAKEFIKDKTKGLFGGLGGASAHIAGVKGAGIIAVGRMLQAAGYQVSEHPAFGGVTAGAHVSNSAHYRAGAIDVNHDQGNEMAWLDRAAKQLLKINHSQIIWRNKDLDEGFFVPNHMNHLHFAMQRGGVLPRFAKGGIPAPQHGSHWIHGSPNYNLNEAATILWQAGLTPRQASDLSRVVPQESGGDPHAGPSSANCKGLFQINPADSQQFPGNLYDPRVNALNAKMLYASPSNRGMQPWVASQSGWTRHGGHILTSARHIGSAKGKVKGKQSGSTSAAPAVFDVNKLMLKANQKETLKLALRKMAKLPGLATTAGDLADRAGELEGLVGGKDEVAHLTEQLNLLWAYRNWLVIAHNLVTRAVAAANEQIAKAKPGAGKTKMKEARNLANTKLTEIGSALTEVQGTVVGASPFGYMKALPSAPGMFGGSIFEVQMRLKDLGEAASATDGKTNLTAGQLKELSYLSSLGVNFNPSQFAGFFAGGGVLGAGQWGIAGERGPEAVVGPAAISPAGGAVNVRVFIGDRELTDIVRVETDSRERGARGAYMAGRGAR